MVEANNGVAVRGLRVIRRVEARPGSWWRSFVVAALLGDGTNWTVLVVNDGPHNTVATRGFVKHRDADVVRERFVSLVADMSQADYERADWQGLLDHL